MPPPSQIAQRIYYDDQQCLEFTAEVTEIREFARVAGKPVFQVALDRTAFYPTSGGQPHDTGLLIATARSGAVLEAEITEAAEDECGEVWHTTLKPLQPGTEVTGRIDAARRTDHMQQHSGQHLLSAIAAREFGAVTVGFHLGEKTSTVDLACSGIDRAQMERLEDLVNEAVSAALPVTQYVVSPGEAERMLEAGELRKLPGRTGDMRIVQIEGTDRNACGGTHVANTAQIGPVLLRKQERVRGNVRLNFLCGRRALAAVREDWGTLSAIALQLSTAPGKMGERVTAMQAEIKSLRKQMRSAQP